MEPYIQLVTMETCTYQLHRLLRLTVVLYCSTLLRPAF